MATLVNRAGSGLPCVLFAVRRESMFFRRRFRPAQSLGSAPCHACLAGSPGDPLLLIETGIGRAAAVAALDWLITAAPSPAFIVYAGFAGALVPALRVADVLIAEEIVDTAGRRWPATLPRSGSVLQPARLLTVDRLVAGVEEKRRHAAQYDAQAVDMEAAHVAAWCAERGIPFACVRAISDDVAMPLSPELAALLSGSRVSLPRVAAALLRRPTLLGELRRLGRDTRNAAHQLSLALEQVLHDQKVRDWQNGSSGQSQEVLLQHKSSAAAECADGDGSGGWPSREK